MDANESDAVMLQILEELRALRTERACFADIMVLVNQTSVRVIEAVERLEARMTLLGAAE